MHPTILVFVCAALLAATPPKPAPARGQAPSRARIEAYLAGHDVPAAAELRAIDPAPEKPLMAIASDEHAERLTRARAVAALRLVPSPAVRAYLAKLIQDNADSSDPTLRLLLRRAAVTLGWIGGGDAAERIADLFQNQDAEVRVDAVLGISMTRAAEAPGLLNKQLAVEPSPRVREQIQRQLVALGAGPEKSPETKKKQPSAPPMRGGF